MEDAKYTVEMQVAANERREEAADNKKKMERGSVELTRSDSCKPNSCLCPSEGFR